MSSAKDIALQMYKQRTRQLATDPTTMPSFVMVLDAQSGENLIDSSEYIPFDDDIRSDPDKPIALRKGKQSCTSHSLYNFMSFAHLLSSFHSFASSLDSHCILKSMSEILLDSD